MALQSNIQIFIGGTPILTYKRLSLQQDIDSHHILTLVCRMDVLERLNQEMASESKNFLGEIITLQVSSAESFSTYGDLEFKGVVVKVNNTKGFNNGAEDTVEIKAQSASVIADDGPHFASHNDVSLGEILNRTFQGYDQSKLKTNFSPQNATNIHYSVQHNDSAYQYASRLAAQYGEWFYYDGKALVFGRPENSDEVILTYGHNLKKFTLELNPIPNNFKYFTNDYLVDDLHEKTTTEVNTGANGYNSFASSKSDQIYAKETNVYLNSYNDSDLKQRFDNQVEQQKKARELKQVLIKGVSDNPAVYLGQVIKIQEGTTAQGSYRITKVLHTATENGNYVNHFEGVTADIDVYPNTNPMSFPRSESQVAVVMDNADPDGLSRIKVQFPWQRPDGETTPWLRMITPHSGGEKGFHFIPEIGEEVLVGFEGGNGERPYVMGALYTGSQNPQSWGTQNNDVKAIRTRSGHTVELNDTRGAEFITITDKNSNIIRIDTANNNIEVSAGETMTFMAKNIKIKAEENIEMVAGNDFTKSVAENYNVMTKNNTLIVEENLSTDSKKQQNVSDEIIVSSNKQNLTLSSGKIVDVQSKEKVKLF
ncbi:type VI secretion system Vgr family protein [Aquimarina sediminis]|uniref:type VI secretion system Vgr family protein n=1 Tax=Aquimarina sediminis TaxID=2070536 RepID=UPI000CA01606|nr:phage baseplate assembly protein V [Aquimarina sediminis]